MPNIARVLELHSGTNQRAIRAAIAAAKIEALAEQRKRRERAIRVLLFLAGVAIGVAAVLYWR